MATKRTGIRRRGKKAGAPAATEIEQQARSPRLQRAPARPGPDARGENGRRRADYRLERANRARRVLVECSHALVHGTDEGGMLASMCRIFVDSGGYRMAWIGLATGDPKRPIYAAAHAGFGTDEPMTGAVSWSADGRYQGFMASVIATGEPHIARNILDDPALAQRRARALQHGFQSSIALPLKSEGAVLGAIAIYAREPDAFDTDEIALLNSLTDDIAFGISSMRTRIAREEAEARSRENERRYREMFEQAAVGISRVDLDGVLVDVNQKFCDMLGFGRGELLGKHVKDITHPEDFGPGSQHRRRMALGSEHSAAGEKRFMRKDGTVMWARRTMSTACDDAGHPQYVISVIEDITEHKLAEARLARLTRARRVAAECNHALVHATTEGELLRTMCENLVSVGGYRQAWIGLAVDDERRSIEIGGSAGYEEGYLEAIERSWSDEGRHRSVMGLVIATGERHVSQNILTDDRLEGRRGRALERNYHSSVTLPLRDAGRTIGGISIYAVEPDAFDGEELELLEDLAADITFGIASIRTRLAHEQAEARLREEERKFRQTFDQAAVGIVHTDLMGRYLMVNQRFCEMVGYTAEELIGTSAAEIAHPDDQDVGPAQRVRLIANVIDTFSEEKRYVRKDGSVIWTDRTVSLARDESGKPLYFIRVIQDVTERKRLEEQVERSFEQAPVGIMHTDIETDRILRANPKLSEMLGYTRRELLSLTTDAILHPEQVDTDRVKYRDKLLRGELESFTSERLYLRKDGTTLPVERTVSLVRDAAGRPEYFLRVVEDISERKRAERHREMEHGVTRALAQAASVAEAMPEILRIICEGLEWACGAHWQYDEKDGVLRIGDMWHGGAARVVDFMSASRGRSTEALDWGEGARAPRTGGVVRSVWRAGAPVWFADVTEQADFRRGALAANAGLHSAFGFPIVAGNQPLGVVEFFSPEIKQPDEALLQIMGAIGSQIGQFIQRKQAEAALRSSEEQLRQLAHYDNLTRLPNRVLFYDRLKQALSQARRNQWTMAVMFLDLDRFKNVNDTLGHGAGDLLLGQVSARLTGCVRSGDTVGRLSGDEFAVVLASLTNPEDAGVVAQKMMTALSQPFDLDGKEVFASASIGITLFPADSTDPETLIRNADAAMYRAKELGRNRIQFYTPEMNARALEKLNLENSLRRAIVRNEFDLHYQPKVSLVNGEVTGVEALLRWQHPDLGMILPGDFIPMLEETGLIIPVGEWVIRTACAQIRAWQAAGIKPVPVAVNLSARQFQASDLGSTISRILEEEGVEHQLLELEITESSIVNNTEEAARTLEFLNALGVRLTIDDFGTGYSSLSYLKRFPLDALKIDSSFVRDISTDPDDAVITRAIITMAHSLELEVIAEGVETEEQLNFLSANACDHIQGFYFASALPARDCTEWLAGGRRLQVPAPAAAARGLFPVTVK
jgi:diguanylate cyclase (GGDEF)-like protein/PAS domain S-box-containing protein